MQLEGPISCAKRFKSSTDTHDCDHYMCWVWVDFLHSKASANTTQSFRKCAALVSQAIKRAHTDRGSEFLGK